VHTLKDDGTVNSGSLGVVFRHGRPEERIVVSCTAPAHLTHTHKHTQET